jgi:hypothetical protein
VSQADRPVTSAFLQQIAIELFYARLVMVFERNLTETGDQVFLYNLLVVKSRVFPYRRRRSSKPLLKVLAGGYPAAFQIKLIVDLDQFSPEPFLSFLFGVRLEVFSFPVAD